MPKLACPCGFVHNLSPIPDDGWVLVRDRDYEELTEAEATAHRLGGGKILPEDHPDYEEWDKADNVYGRVVSRMYECPECGRIMWEKPGDGYFTIYRLNNDD